LAEIGPKVERNIRDRVSAITIIGDNASKAVKGTIEHLKKLEPVQGLAYLTATLGVGVANFVKKQAEITRRWIG